MDLCPNCSRKINESEIYGDWFYCEFCNKEFAYKEENQNKEFLTMTDRYIGFLVTLEKEMRCDDAESIITALKMVKGVSSVKPYVANLEDYLLYEKGKNEIRIKVMEFLSKDLK